MSRSNGVSIRLVIMLISSSLLNRNLLVFASPVEQSFKRPDPLNHFKSYNGVYDVTNRNYWASAAFTGFHCYTIAGIWFLIGFGFGSYVILKHLFGKTSSIVNHHDYFYIIVFSLILFLTLLAIVSSSLVLASSKSTYQRANRLMNTIFGAASDSSNQLRRAINSLLAMQTFLRPYDRQTCDLLNVTTHRLRRESLNIQNFVGKTKRPSDRAVDILYSTTLAVVTANLVLLVAALVPLIMHWHPGILVIIFCCWILTTLSWVLTGLDYFFQTFTKDTCTAFGSFEQDPNNRSLHFIHPCASPDDSYKLLVQVGQTVRDFISQLNTKLTEIKAILEVEEGNEYLSGIREICNPFAGAPNYTYAPQYCTKDATPIGDLSMILSRFTCYHSKSSEECLGEGRFIPESSYLMARAYIHSVQDLIDVFPDLLSLTNCTSVKQAFSDIVKRQCRPLKASVRMLWLSSLSLSIAMMVLVSLWVAKLHQDWQRTFAKFHIVPNPV